jgi:hypothetical protein
MESLLFLDFPLIPPHQMRTLEALAFRRLEASRITRGRWDIQSVLIGILTVTALVSIGVSFWVFSVSELPHLASLRHSTPVLGQVHPFRLSLPEIHSQILKAKETTFIYPHVPSDCVPAWVRDVASVPNDEDYEHHWSYTAKFILLPTSASCSQQAMNELLDSDPIIAGMTLVWINADPSTVPEHHLMYPESFLVRHGASVGLTEPGKVWKVGDPEEEISTSDLCMYHLDNFWSILQNKCVPINRKGVRRPLGKVVRWDTVFIDTQTPGDYTSKRNAMAAIFNFVSELSVSELFLANLAFT